MSILDVIGGLRLFHERGTARARRTKLNLVSGHAVDNAALQRIDWTIRSAQTGIVAPSVDAQGQGALTADVNVIGSLWDPLQLGSALDAFFRPDLAGSDDVQWIDAKSGHVLAQATPALRPEKKTEAAFNNKHVYKFDGTTQLWDCTSPVGTWKKHHDGTGSDVYSYVQFTAGSGAVWATCASNAPSTSRGAMMFGYTEPAGGDYWFGVQNGATAGRCIDSTSPGTALTDATPHVLRQSLVDSEVTKWLHAVDGVTVASGTSYAQALSSGNEAGPMRVGGELSGATARMAAMLLSDLIFCNRRLSAAEDSLVRGYISARYSNTFHAVTLRAAAARSWQLIANETSSDVRVYPAAGDDLGAGVNQPGVIEAGKVAGFFAIDSTKWKWIIGELAV